VFGVCGKLANLVELCLLCIRYFKMFVSDYFHMVVAELVLSVLVSWVLVIARNKLLVCSRLSEHGSVRPKRNMLCHDRNM
jgi:hypothetical protein